MTVPKPDAVASAVVTNAGGKGAVRFEGWVGPYTATGAASDPFQLYTKPGFMEWLEIDASDLLSQVSPAATDPQATSVIWVKREAMITKCQAGYAYQFEAAPVDDSSAIYPRPYH